METTFVDAVIAVITCGIFTMKTVKTKESEKG